MPEDLISHAKVIMMDLPGYRVFQEAGVAIPTGGTHLMELYPDQLIPTG